MQGFAVFPGRQTPNPVPGCSGGREQPLDTGLVGGWQPAPSPLGPPIPPFRARFQVSHSPFLNCLPWLRLLLSQQAWKRGREGLEQGGGGKVGQQALEQLLPSSKSGGRFWCFWGRQGESCGG